MNVFHWTGGNKLIFGGKVSNWGKELSVDIKFFHKIAGAGGVLMKINTPANRRIGTKQNRAQGFLQLGVKMANRRDKQTWAHIFRYFKFGQALLKYEY